MSILLEMADKQPRLVPIPLPTRVLEESEMRAAFASCASDNELWLAINQRLREMIVAVAMDVADPETAREYGALAHCAGGMEWLGRLQADLATRFAETHEGDIVVS